ncbi:MAG: hypothetical protein CL840_12040 [Crocinitomicaceae bacterium]|nr:hypothetical protein [Crocinitomicaceae bacterium]|tara:strand:- start:8440 stop:9147 length:708 start_codon:yes stop_codon:yes gene_type:complete
MKKFVTSIVFIAMIVSMSYGQDTSSTNNKKISHYLGVQANELIKQLFSFGNPIETGNPYLIKYALRFNESNMEIMAGLGYRSSSSNQNGGNFKTSNSEYFFRLGVAKKFNIGRRWEAGVGIDGITGQSNDQSENINFTSGTNFTDSSYSSTKNVVRNFGVGPQFTMAYYISPRIKLGTELTTYFTYSEDKFENKTERTSVRNGIRTTTSSEESGTTFSNNLDLNVPLSIFLIVKF